MAVVVGIGRRWGLRHLYDGDEGGDAHVGGDGRDARRSPVVSVVAGGTFESRRNY